MDCPSRPCSVAAGSGTDPFANAVVPYRGDPAPGTGAERDSGHATLFRNSGNSFPRMHRRSHCASTTTSCPRPTCLSRDLLHQEKDSSINDHRTDATVGITKSLLERDDVVIVATVSCIYGIGIRDEYHNMILTMRMGRSTRPASDRQAAYRDTV